MRFGISAKLFLAILVSCIVVAFAMGAAVRITLQTGFQSYVEQREEQRAGALTDVLAELYRENGNWQFLREQPRRWWRILRSTPGTEARDGRPEPQEGYTPPPPFYLTDAGGDVVSGVPSDTGNHDTTPRFAIEVDGNTVGWLVRQPRARQPNALDERFLGEQLKATWIISALSLLLAALVSSLLARTLLAPVRRIGRATHALAAGDYSTRVQAGSRDELGELAKDFNQLAITLERNEKLRRDMMADISHELRTPLAVLRGELEAMQDGVRTLTPAAIESLQAEVATLHQLINDLHELSMADAGALNYRMTEVDIVALVRAACNAFADRMAAKSLMMEVGLPDKPVLIQGDPQRLTQLFNNLLENSLRYTDPGGTLQLAMHTDADRVHITLLDSAPGVPEELLPRLFERLFRADPSRSREGGGSGLGLAISQRIVEAHRGGIEALPSSLGGICMALSFPLSTTLE